MVRKKKTKTASLMLAAVMILASFIYVEDWAAVGVSTENASLAARLVFPFFHANPLHALLNVWVMLSVVFLYEVSFLRIMLALLCSMIVPACVLSDSPTIGFSCSCYFLMGTLLPQAARKWRYLLVCLLYIGIGFLIPGLNALIHLYGYCAGLIVGVLNASIQWLRLRR